MRFTFSIKNTEPLKNEETETKQYSNFDGQNLKTKSRKNITFVTIVFITTSKTYYA